MNVDLHCHSTISDGLLRPSEVVLRARAQGVDLLSLTDHDEVSGWEEARRAALECGIDIVAGVEISVSYGQETVHILGLNIDPTCPELVQGLAATRSGRERRGQQMGEGLALVGIEGAYEGALRFVGNPDLISRTHFARFLVDHGVCRTTQDVFNKYLTPGKPGYVPMQWATLSQALEWIDSAGGIAVVAHPGRYRFTPLQLTAFLEDFKNRGGQGIEVITGSHSPDQYKQFALVAQEYGFLASRGSDFHGPGESRLDLGQLPPLPDTLTPVWTRWTA